SFGYLDDDFGTDRIDVRNVLRGQAFFGLLAVGPLDFFNPTVERSRDRIPEMKEGVLVEADVDEHCLETGFDVFDPSLEDTACDVALALALDVILFELSILEQGDAPLEFFHTDNQLVPGLATQAK